MTAPELPSYHATHIVLHLRALATVPLRRPLLCSAYTLAILCMLELLSYQIPSCQMPSAAPSSLMQSLLRMCNECEHV